MLFPTLAALATLLLPAPAGPLPRQAALTDANIVAIFDVANTYDIETGNLAKSRGASKEARATGASLVRDHEAVRQQARDLAKKLGVAPVAPAVNPLAEQHAKALQVLRTARGPAFDKAFLEHEVAFHQAVIDAVTKSLLPAIKNAELKAFVEKVAPAFQAHLDMCKAALTQLKL